MSEDNKELIARGIELGKTVVHYGWVPLILFIGWNSSNPKPNLIKLISPLA
ncbi:hypothetical protein BCR35DRAFT_331742 [Leucosporidium creatinivorum]|uniref:Tom7-domain-containing protein n=1 Tax=Leucosporidium creatinivorum TaxID=106004 RepID=A0A1Y2FB50_9BASI|nr:hypothetical protein BCR35DRAFT_331742 [Leucosporidium creatinivorum]